MQPKEDDKTLKPKTSESPEEISAELSQALPDEVMAELEKMSPQMRGIMSMSFMQRELSSGSPIAKKLTPELIGKLIDNNEKDNQRELEKFRSAENTKRLSLGSILSLVLMVLIYAGVTQDKQLSEKIITAGLGVLAGFGAGYAIAKKDK